MPSLILILPTFFFNLMLKRAHYLVKNCYQFVSCWQRSRKRRDTLTKNPFKIHSFLKQWYSFYENKFLQLMSAWASLGQLGKVWWKDLVSIKWRSRKHSFKYKWTLADPNLIPRDKRYWRFGQLRSGFESNKQKPKTA